MQEKIIKILAEIRPEYDFTDNVNFIEASMLDSFDLLTLVAELDANFGIKIDGAHIVPENFESVLAIKELVIKSKKI